MKTAELFSKFELEHDHSTNVLKAYIESERFFVKKVGQEGGNTNGRCG